MTGIKFDIDRLREVMGYANEMARGWKQVLELNTSRPSLFNALTDGTIYLGVANGFRGAPEGGRYFTELVEEMAYKARTASARPDEKYRLTFVGVPCYPIFRRFNELFTEWGGTFVRFHLPWFRLGRRGHRLRVRPARPLESLAEGVLIGVRDAMDSMFHQDRALLGMIDDRFIWTAWSTTPSRAAARSPPGSPTAAAR